MALGGVRGLALNAFLVTVIGTVMRAMWQNRNLTDGLAFYGSYHQNPMNQAIHFIFVPLLLWSFIVLHHYVPLLGCCTNSDITLFGHRLTYGTVIAVIYTLYYPVLLDLVAGSIYAIIVGLFYASANRLVEAPPRDGTASAKKTDKRQATSKRGGGRTANALRLAAGCQALGWYMQLHPGHAVYEGVKPALLDGLGQSLSVAPLFAFYEGLWAVGIRRDLHKQTATLVSARRAAMCDIDKTHRFCQ